MGNFGNFINFEFCLSDCKRLTVPTPQGMIKVYNLQGWTSPQVISDGTPVPWPLCDPTRHNLHRRYLMHRGVRMMVTQH